MEPTVLKALGIAAIALFSAPVVAHAVEQYRPHDFVWHAKVSGNPYEREVFGEMRGPKGQTFRVRGFYDGEDTWKVRVMAPVPGEWSLRTQSNVPELDGRTERFVVQPAANRLIHGRLRVDAGHPHHFRFEDGTRFFLMGYEADFLWAAGMQDPGRRVMRRLIDQIGSRGFNYVLVNVYAHDTRWAPGRSCEWDYGPPPLFVFGGSNREPDHTRLNPKFFQAYDEMMWALWDRGIVAHVMIKVLNKAVNWPAGGSEEERRYFRYVVARYQAFPNLNWDYSKESFKEPDDLLKRHTIDLIHNEDAYGHLVASHDNDRYEWDPVLGANLDFRVDQQHSNYAEQAAFDRRLLSRPIVNAEFGYEFGVEKLPTHAHVNQADWKELLRRAYVVYFAGAYGVYYYNNTAWDVIKPDPEPPGMARWQILNQTLSTLPYWRMEPRNDLAVGGPCFTDGEHAAAVYVTSPAVTINLRDFAGDLDGVWTDTWTGEHAPEKKLAPKVHVLRKPKSFGDDPAVLALTR